MKWIPCKEGMPEQQTTILATTSGGLVIQCIYFGVNVYGHHVWKSIGDMWRYWDDEIVAWMPMPEPWRGERDG